jgi:hypothetical protein
VRWRDGAASVLVGLWLRTYITLNRRTWVRLTRNRRTTLFNVEVADTLHGRWGHDCSNSMGTTRKSSRRLRFWNKSEPKKSLSTAREKNSLSEVLDEKIKMYSCIDHAGMYTSQIKLMSIQVWAAEGDIRCCKQVVDETSGSCKLHVGMSRVFVMHNSKGSMFEIII